jgi:hypothetical protein
MLKLLNRGLLVLAAAGAAMGANPAFAHSRELDVRAVKQQTPSWCWAASASMALKFLGFPDINEASNYQCGVVAATFPECEDDCTRCNLALDQMPSFVEVLQRYRDRARQNSSSRLQASLRPKYVAYPEFARIKRSIDHSYPVIGGISLGQGPSDPALAQHAVLITGYDDDHRGTGEPWVVVIDPYPYERGESPWANAGYRTRSSSGKLLVPWRFIRERMNLTSAVFLEDPSA